MHSIDWFSGSSCYFFPLSPPPPPLTLTMTTLTAPVKWAQRKDSLYVTISLPDVHDQQIDCTSNKITFM